MNAVIAQARQNLLDRCGKSGKHQLFNTSLTSGQAVRITRRKVNGQLQRRPQGESLVQESKDVKNYLTKNKFEVFSGGFKSSLNSNWTL
ncbi:hypothetical protein QS257_20465 [Terrilactibacillus sp. S3-3]|nr:hypothetical protein QS257_20465 [Terrilactibacillus sp. S3-3]